MGDHKRNISEAVDVVFMSGWAFFDMAEPDGNHLLTIGLFL
jgi:hypothetical protein